LLSSDITAEAAFLAGYDAKKSEIHGMAQRGGSVTSSVRFGDRVYSPLIPAGRVDYLVSFHDTERDRWRHLLSPGGKIIQAGDALLQLLPHPRTLNVALLGVLSRELPFTEEAWEEAMKKFIKSGYLDLNRAAFERGREGGEGGVEPEV
jgi:indolepyruvate ferredoxin oxidoreductase beta subunit